MSSDRAGRSDLDLLALNVATGHTLNGAGDLLLINEKPARPAPKVFLGRTREGDRLWFRHDVAQDDRERVAAWAGSLATWDGSPTPSALDGLAGALGCDGRRYAGPEFVFRQPLFPMGAMVIYPSQAAALHPELVEWALELRERRPCYGVFQGGQAVAICCSARSGPEAAAAGVETVAAFRGRGFAALATEAWAADIRRSGRVPFYGTTWENAASRSVARKLGLTLLAEHIHLT